MKCVCLSLCVKNYAIETFLDVDIVPENKKNDTWKLRRQNYLTSDHEKWVNGLQVIHKRTYQIQLDLNQAQYEYKREATTI